MGYPNRIVVAVMAGVVSLSLSARMTVRMRPVPGVWMAFEVEHEDERSGS